MKSLRIPEKITLSLFKGKNKNIIQLKNNKTSVWFLTDDFKIKLHDNKVITATSQTIRFIKKALISIEIGHKRCLQLLAVGHKASLNDERILSVKLNSTNPTLFKVPNDIAISINRDKINCWSYHPTKIDHFLKKIKDTF